MCIFLWLNLKRMLNGVLHYHGETPFPHCFGEHCWPPSYITLLGDNYRLASTKLAPTYNLTLVALGVRQVDFSCVVQWLLSWIYSFSPLARASQRSSADIFIVYFITTKDSAILGARSFVHDHFYIPYPSAPRQHFTAISVGLTHENPGEWRAITCYTCWKNTFCPELPECIAIRREYRQTPFC